jgi:hypothetical protein
MIQFGVNFARSCLQVLEGLVGGWALIVSNWEDLDTPWDELD